MRITNPAKRSFAMLIALMMVFTFVPFASAAYNGEGLPINLTFDDLAEQEKIAAFTPASDAVTIEIGVDSPAGDGGAKALKAVHTPGATYTAADNAVRITLAEPLPRGGRYKITWSVYIPSEGNPSGANFTGPALVLNRDYAGSTLKLPSSPAALGRDTWRVTEITSPMMFTDLKYIDFRFPVNTSPQHPDEW